jgi:hypothetical protein
VNQIPTGKSVGGTPTEAVETTALPKKSLMIAVDMPLMNCPLDECGKPDH